jgi:hypothetical protein
MTKTRSARGAVVDFDMLAIKQQLMSKPTPVSVNDRRRFIDEKDGAKSRTTVIPAALSMAVDSAKTSEKSKK